MLAPRPRALLTCLLGLVLVTACEGKPAAGTTGKTGGAAPVLALGAPVPPFAGTTLRGEPLSLAELRGRVVLLNVWATWCDPCREELPDLQALHVRHEPEGLTVLGVSTDAARDAKTLRTMVSGFGLTYPVIHDERNVVSGPFQVIGYPASYLIDRAGNLRWRRDGLIPTGDPELAAALAAALAEPAP
ncbi:TlpA disulfide reductase family protein [Nannocystis sp. ILAH1]|uniref:TlpA disulfide reductase family protein n=1 Tax=unclassified Nannocystis TaxID=2627009 RepID=UPI00226D569E|nr:MULTISPECIES: TlpA disulfide reductase family protein [unclassified Nannocystis]MCY0985658.1 TlpA disulfide reductase family protein [Nannocystis sp. ILAH1]MCY1068343.1 TlpA disulfide reductase family protein [Nannocystis sp. RBIL2]